MTGKLLDDVESIIEYSQDYPFDVDCSELLKTWEKAKKPIIEIFDGKLIVRSTRPVKITLSEEQQSRRFKEFIRTLDDNAVLTEEFEQFLKLNEKGFFDNRVVVPFPNKDIKIGTKLSRTFQRFVENVPDMRWVQDMASYYIQENKIEGYLYLSVDPRDFLTLSETNAKWKTCQSLDGEYRAGNLNYMVDETTIVAYLASGKQEVLKCMPRLMTWNSKKWRMLVHINKNCIYYNNQYPFFSEGLLNEVYKMILEYFGHYEKPSGYGFKIVQNQLGEQQLLEYNQLALDGMAVDTREIIDTSDYLGYCDLIYSSSYSPIVSVANCKNKFYNIYRNMGKTKEEMLQQARAHFGIKVGGKAPCVCCGQEVIKRDCSFLCQDCIALNDADEDFFLKCESCSHRIYPDDEVFWRNSFPYCKTCYSAMQKEDLLEEEE